MWAPDVAQFGNHYMLYFTSQHRTFRRHQVHRRRHQHEPCRALHRLADPVHLPASLGGSIDPRVFVDSNGQAYMVWKSDQNAITNGGPTQIWSQPLSADGTQLLGSPTAIFAPDEAWQNSIVEAPQMVLVQGTSTTSSTRADTSSQPATRIGVARCVGPLGPCQDASGTPLLGSNLQGWGPGEESIFTNSTGDLDGLLPLVRQQLSDMRARRGRSRWPVLASGPPAPTWRAVPEQRHRRGHDGCEPRPDAPPLPSLRAA